MVLELATIVLGAAVAAVAVLYAAPKGYFGHRKTKSSNASMENFAPAAEQAAELPAAEAPAAPEAAPSPSPAPEPAPAPALYESVQPAPAPVTYSAPATTSFGAPTLAKKPTRTYRRRTAPIRSSSGAAHPKATKPKKR